MPHRMAGQPYFRPVEMGLETLAELLSSVNTERAIEETVDQAYEALENNWVRSHWLRSVLPCARVHSSMYFILK